MTDASAIIDEALSEPVPEPSEDSFTLPGGLLLDGRVHRHARIREMNGADEEALARAAKAKTVMPMYRTILENCLEDIDGVKPTAAQLDTLYYGDRDAILLAVRRATYGSEYETTVTCPRCRQDSEVIFDLRSKDEGGDIPVRSLEDPEEWVRRVELRRPGSFAMVHLVTCAEQAESAMPELTPAEMNTILLAHCVHEIDGEPVLSTGDAQRMSAGDRRIIGQYLLDHAPGPLLGEVMAPCIHCGVDSEIALSMAALFL